MSAFGGWAWFTSNLTRELHYLPVGDDRLHILVGKICWCKPFQNEAGIVHNSYDEREKFELGWRKPN